MKKIIAIVLLLFPMLTNAKIIDASPTDLETVFASKNMEYQFTPLEKKADKVPITLFWGNTCIHCTHFIEYLKNTLIPNYQDKFYITTYEIYQNKNNKELMDAVSKKLNINAKGVPFIIVGEKYFIGFSENTQKEIPNEIINAYQNNKTTDIVEKVLEREVQKEKITEFFSEIFIWLENFMKKVL